MLPAVVQGALIFFTKLFFRRQEAYFSDYALDITSIVNFNLFIGVMVVIHSRMSYITILLLAPLAVISIYKQKQLIYIQLVISIVLYVVSSFSLLPQVEYWMDGMPGLHIVTFLAWSCVFVVIGEQMRQATLQLE